MASTYSSLKIQLMATGENSGTWGTVTNTNLGTALEEAIVGSADVTFSSGNVTLTLTDTNATQTARNLRLNLTGTTGGARDLIVPAIEKIYIINNGCADAVTVKNSTGTGIEVPAGKTMYVYNNGTNVVDAITHLTSLTLGTPLATTQGGTGANSLDGLSFSGANITSLNASNISSGTLAVDRGGTGATTLNSEAVIVGNGTGAVKFVDPGTSGNVLTSNGTAWVSEAAGSAGGDYVMTAFTSPGTWTKPAGLKAVKVTVVGGGGGGANYDHNNQTTSSGAGAGGAAIEYLDAPAIPGPVSVTVGSGGTALPGPTPAPAQAPTGGTSSFGSFCSATGGSGGRTADAGSYAGAGGGAGGIGSGGTINIRGGGGTNSLNNPIGTSGAGGPSILGGGGQSGGPFPVAGNGADGGAYGGGASGRANMNTGSPVAGYVGAAGVVIVEEFY